MKRIYAPLLLLLAICSCRHEGEKNVWYKNAPQGYYFLYDGKELQILDKDGSIVYYKSCDKGLNFSLQPNGLMSYAGGNKFYLLDSTFREIDSVACTGIPQTDPRDMRILPNGHFLMLGSDSVRMNLRRYDFAGGRGSDSALVRWAVVQELDTAKHLVFDWRSEKYFDFGDVDTFFLHSDSELYLIHPNSIELDTDGNILLSSRNLHEITKINRKNGSVIWRWGGKHNQFRFINCSVPFYGQHDVRRISNGHISLFDNGARKNPNASRALEFELDEVNKTAKLIWSFTLDTGLHSKARGNVQRLPENRTLINYGDRNREVCFVVIDSSGTVLFQLNGIASYRVLFYETLPWKLHRPQITCFDSAGVAYMDAGAGYKSYRWSTGDSSRIVQISAAGNYSVFVPYGNGGYISSEKFDAANPGNVMKQKCK